jgi:hypothetical protein
MRACDLCFRPLRPPARYLELFCSSLASMGVDAVALLSEIIVKWMKERFAGPATAESKELSDESEALRTEARRLETLASAKISASYAARRATKLAKHGFFRKNREALIVNMVAGLIVGIPFLIVGVVLGRI